MHIIAHCADGRNGAGDALAAEISPLTTKCVREDESELCAAESPLFVTSTDTVISPCVRPVVDLTDKLSYLNDV